MGTDVYAYAFVGVPVAESDFWVLRSDDDETCHQGHARKEGAGAYCDQDGSPFQRQIRKVPTAGFRQLVEHLSLEATDDWEALYNDLCTEMGIVRDASSLRSSYPGQSMLVLSTGVCLKTRSSRDSATGTVSWGAEKIQQQFETVQKLASIMGLTQPPVLYVQQYWSR